MGLDFLPRVAGEVAGAANALRSLRRTEGVGTVRDNGDAKIRVDREA